MAKKISLFSIFSTPWILFFSIHGEAATFTGDPKEFHTSYDTYSCQLEIYLDNQLVKKLEICDSGETRRELENRLLQARREHRKIYFDSQATPLRGFFVLSDNEPPSRIQLTLKVQDLEYRVQRLENAR